MKPAHRICRVLLAGLVLLSFLSWARFSLCAVESVDQAFSRARSEFQAALSVAQKERKVEALRRCIQRFEQILRQDGTGRYSDKCIYLIAQSHHMIHDITRSQEDLKGAKEGYKTVVQKYPGSPLADDAQYLTGVLYLANDPPLAYVEFSKVGLYFPHGDMKPKAEQIKTQLGKKLGYDSGKNREALHSGNQKDAASPRPLALPSGAQNGSGAAYGQDSSLPASKSSSLSISSGSPAGGAQPPSGSLHQPASSPKSNGLPARGSSSAVNQLKRVQHWSGPDYTRVVLYMSDPVSFKEQATQADPKAQQPGRICLDLKNCVLASKVAPHIRVMNSFLREVHSAQVDSVQARVVLDTEPIDSYRIFSMADPFRLIIDVRGRKPKAEPPVVTPTPHPGSALAKLQPDKLPGSAPSLAKQLGLGVRRIVLDPGHGGKDKGASSPNNVYEKDITLAIAKELKEVLEAETGCEVILTRTRDRFLSLEERTAIANTQKADLFISIHTNAHANRSFHGVETYFLNLSKDKESARVAALENATSTKKISDLEAILQDLMLHTKINESSHLASEVQGQIVGKLKANYEGVRDLGIKQAPFYVLLGAEMPSILIETAFLTNEREERRLKDPNFQEHFAKAITAGIVSYIRQMKGFAKAGDPS